MIARVAYFEGLTQEQKRVQDDNTMRRFKAALTSQPGLVALFYLERPNGDRVGFSVWESAQAMEEGGSRANAVPLLTDQRGEDIPSPTRMEVWAVRDHFLSGESVGSKA
jgi:hypothetical protein